MNYLEAHKICFSYADIFAKEKRVYRPISDLYSHGIQSKKMVEDAMILFFAHSILWNEYTNSEMQQMETLLSFLDCFVDDSFAKEYERNFEIAQKGKTSVTYRFFHQKEFDAATKYILDNTKLSMFDDKRFVMAVNHITEYKRIKYTPKAKMLFQKADTITSDQFWEPFLNLVGDYSDEICHFAGISTKSFDYYYFMSFEIMHDWLTDENLCRFYQPYKDYILNHSDNWNK